MTETHDPSPQGEEQGAALDPMFFTATNAYLDVANKQAQTHGMKRVSAALLYAAARYNAHAYVGMESDPEGTKAEFKAYMLDLYQRMLDENLENLLEGRASADGAQGDAS